MAADLGLCHHSIGETHMDRRPVDPVNQEMDHYSILQ